MDFPSIITPKYLTIVLNKILCPFKKVPLEREMAKNPNITIHPLSNDPTGAWKIISQQQKVITMKIKTPTASVTEDKVRFVCMSDTHSFTWNIKFTIPNGDVFIHAGDFTFWGGVEEVIKFNEWLGTLPHKHKIIIAGNHDHSFDKKYKMQFTNEDIRDYLTNCTYLENSSIELYGIKLYGSPCTPSRQSGFGTVAFNLKRGIECLSKWNEIPNDTDILITHTPPLGYGDLTRSNVRAGCVELLSTVQQRVIPKYHIFGHIHEGYGITSDGNTIFINASTCDINYTPKNLPIVFDLPLQDGFVKD